ncbi:tRNA threonylcarbamoyl adenosine modification protein YeaZ [Kineococcus xinjiangensis]|uniref:tRNA threonylcarbamoyl adenosine modification protein YeaZ n=1 Tax=Kineococcus xinjiangensis TaxID=512762 RepID=A0A2S6ITK4_9ACTN|nr:tRNA (adenosine(37)-N6)-threonylcarbamoyltransferase complex dimerization subunit type 1 TsaB [Kineococcus xinjiangensis]PPK97582.1 tRNA threonylcarbamoyl adenosine modification protein YeaZ [Kineococcus xinjiangensis]
MLLLALDTATATATVALHDGERVLASLRAADARKHAENLVPAVQAVLAETGRARRDVTAIAAGVGPGPFTGLRVGLVTALSLGMALGVDVHGVCSLDALAAEALATGAVAEGEEFVVATDARRREVHSARYGGSPLRRLTGPQVGPAADVERSGLRVVGSGVPLYPDALGPRPGRAEDSGPLDVDAAHLAAVAAAALRGEGGWQLLPPEPLYLRRPDAVEPGARKRVTA